MAMYRSLMYSSTSRLSVLSPGRIRPLIAAPGGQRTIHKSMQARATLGEFPIPRHCFVPGCERLQQTARCIKTVIEVHSYKPIVRGDLVVDALRVAYQLHSTARGLKRTPGQRVGAACSPCRVSYLVGDFCLIGVNAPKHPALAGSQLLWRDVVVVDLYLWACTHAMPPVALSVGIK